VRPVDVERQSGTEVQIDVTPIPATHQSRQDTLVNFNPRNSDWEYTLYLGIVSGMIGLRGEFYTHQYTSASRGARRSYSGVPRRSRCGQEDV